MSRISATLHSRDQIAKALCIGIATAFTVASFSSPASARWANANDHRVEHHEQRQGWNGNNYRAPPIVYQQYGAPAYFAPPLVYGSGINLNVNIP